MTPILSNEAHARILYAYVARLPLRDLIEIQDRSCECWHAAMNLGLSAQIEAQEEMARAVSDAVRSMGDHDKLIVEEVLRSAMANPA